MNYHLVKNHRADQSSSVMYSVLVALQEMMDLRGLLVVQEPRVSVDLQAGLGLQENLANKDFLAHQEKWEDLVLKGHLDFEVLLDLKDSREDVVPLGLRVH